MAPAPRIHVILAREAHSAVVFRRGPSRWVLVLRWDTDADSITAGDWFRGRLYERRCDLTPDGTHLVYFAATFGAHRQPELDFGHSWTGISQVPHLEPVGLWVKEDCWWGGGLFRSDTAVELNEHPGTLDDQRARHRFRVAFDAGAHGEDEPIYGRRMARDGWTLAQELEAHLDHDLDAASGGFVTAQPQVRTKPGPHRSLGGDVDRHTLEATWALDGYRSVRAYALVDEHGVRHPLDDVEWADWDHRGRLVVARLGTIATATLDPNGVTFTTLFDLGELTPPGTGRERAAP